MLRRGFAEIEVVWVTDTDNILKVSYQNVITKRVL